MSTSLWYQQQTSPFLCSGDDEEPPNQQTAPHTAHNYYDSCTTNNKSSAVTFHNMNSDFSRISDFEDFSHFYDDNRQQHHQAVTNVLTTTTLAEKKKGTTFHVKEKKGRQRNRWNEMKENNVVKKIKNTRNMNKKGEEKAVDDEEVAAGSRDVCVYMRAKKGQAINSHSLAERVRRQKLRDKMKVLQSLVPGCDKMEGKILILDKIIDHIHSLQDKLKSLMSELTLADPALDLNFLALELTKLQTEKSYTSTAGLECMRISSEHQSIPLNESSWVSAPLSQWLALLEDREYTI